MKEEQDSIDLFNILDAVKREKKIIIIITSVITIVTFLICLLSVFLPTEHNFLPNKYTASSIIKINETAQATSGYEALLSSGGGSQISGILGLSGETNSNSEWSVELLRSRTMLDMIMKKFDLINKYSYESKYPILNTRNKILENLGIEISEKTGSLTITYTDTDKELAANIVNEIIYMLESKFKEIDYDSNKTSIEILEKKISDKEILIQDLLIDMIDFKQNNNILDPYVMSQEITRKSIALQTTINRLETEIDFLKHTFSEDSPEIFNKEIELKRSKKLLDSIDDGSGSADIPGINEMTNLLIIYESKKNHIEAQRKIYLTILEQYELLKLKNSGTAPTFQVIEYAEVPLKKSGPSRRNICIVGLFIGLFISFSYVFLKSIKITRHNNIN